MKFSGVLRRWAAALLVLAVALPFMALGTPAAEAATATYRALLIGNNAYVRDPLRGCINDAKAVKAALESSTKLSYAKRSLLTDLKGAELEKAFSQLSGWGIGNADVTLIYYSGHGYIDAATGDTGIVGTDLKKISFASIEKALSQINGTIVLLLDSCHSGGAIAKSASGGSEDAASEVKRYNQSVTKAFGGNAGVNAKAMTGAKYHVITAASSKQYSYEAGGYGYFTTGLTEALGWNCLASKLISPLPGDASGDGKLSVDEAYRYARDVVKDFRGEGGQDVQVSPAGSTLALVKRAVASSGGGGGTSASLNGLPNPTRAVLAPGQVLQMNNAQSLSWQSSKPAVASVSASGAVSAKKNGKAQLVGKKGGKVVVKCNLDVVDPGKVVKSVDLSGASLSGYVGRSLKLTARVNPSGALKKAVRWYSSNKSVAAVRPSGVVVLKKQGTAKIYCIASSGLSDSCVISVSAAPVTRVAMKRAKASVRTGKKLKLQAKALPGKAANRKLRWSSANTAVVAVDPDTGVISGVAPGTAYVTASATDGSGKSAKCLVRVLPKK